MKIICFGDSNTWGYDPRGYFGGQYSHPWPEILAEKLSCIVLNWGENGREISSGIVGFPKDADLVIIMLGTNNLLQGTCPEEVSNMMEHFLESLDQENLLLIAPPPMKLGTWVPSQNLIAQSESLAELYQTLAEHLKLRYANAGKWNVPLAFDGVHLTEDGHRVFADRLIEYLHKGE